MLRSIARWLRSLIWPTKFERLLATVISGGLRCPDPEVRRIFEDADRDQEGVIRALQQAQQHCAAKAEMWNRKRKRAEERVTEIKHDASHDETDLDREHRAMQVLQGNKHVRGLFTISTRWLRSCRYYGGQLDFLRRLIAFGAIPADAAQQYERFRAQCDAGDQLADDAVDADRPEYAAAAPDREELAKVKEELEEIASRCEATAAAGPLASGSAGGRPRAGERRAGATAEEDARRRPELE